MAIYSFIALISYMSGIFHAFHISVCEINHDQERQALEIAQRIFLDDLEEGLILWSGDKTIDVTDPADKIALDSLLKGYFTEQFDITVNGQQKSFNYLGSKVQGDIMELFVEIPRVKKLNTLEIRNSILLDLFPDQVNLIHVTKEGELKSLKLETSKPTGILTWP